MGRWRRVFGGTDGAGDGMVGEGGASDERGYVGVDGTGSLGEEEGDGDEHHSDAENGEVYCCGWPGAG